MNMKKKLRKLYASLLAGLVAVFPTKALAADPEGIVRGLGDEIISFFMVASPIAGTVAIMALGTMYKLSNESHKKSELKGHMKGVVGIVAVVMSAGAIIQWVVTAVK
jgi:heme/copper-type cytochrome/quinol oxidase subunit 2